MHFKSCWGNIYTEISRKTIPGEQILRVAATLQFGPTRGKPVPADDSLEQFREECKTAQKPQQISEQLYDVGASLCPLRRTGLSNP